MKLIEITGMPKAKNQTDLRNSIVDGKFTKDGSGLKILANFSCESYGLSSLIGCPREIGESFYCYNNKLTNLKGAPRKVGRVFNCSQNQITSLEGCPEEVGDIFRCEKNNLTSLKDIHKHIKKINGAFYADDNPIKSHVLGLLKIPGCRKFFMYNEDVQIIINKYLPLGDLIDCQEELIEAGFPEYAQL